MNRNFGLKSFALAALAGGFLLTSSPAQAASTTISLTCPTGIFYATARVYLNDSTGTYSRLGPYDFNCGVDSPSGLRTAKATISSGFKPDSATFTIVLPEPQGQHGECPTTTVALPLSTTCTGGIPASVQGVAKTKLVIR